jgi:integrase/recombinase XerD
MGTISWTCGGSPLTSFAADYGEALVGLGYQPGTAKRLVTEMGGLSCWMADHGVEVNELTEGRVDEFVASCAALGRQIPSRRPLLEVLVVLLRRVGGAPGAVVAEPTPTEELINRYALYLTRERGLAPSTVDRYVRMAKVFLTERAAGVGGTGAEGLDAAEVFAYLLRLRGRLSVGSTKREADDLRSLLRFLYWDRIIEVDLGTALPPVAAWRNTGTPQSVSPVEVRALLEGCDRSGSDGQRDFAILTLIARLGLRACEVARLELDDIDWRAGEIAVRGKGRRVDRLPMCDDVGEALVDYLQQGRPAGNERHVFLTLLAPHVPICACSLTDVVYRACGRAGVARVGPHRLRHGLATDLLAQGATLVEVSQVLRHRDLATTAVYAKVDFVRLIQVAQPWPGARR